MADEGRWTPSVDAVRTVTQELGEAIRFGLALFPKEDALTQAGVQTYVIGYDTVGPDCAELAAVLDGFAQRGGTGDMMHRPVEDATSLVDELRSITAAVVSCNLTLDAAPPAPESVQVLVDGAQVNLGEVDGWEMDGETGIRLVGVACDELSDGAEHLLEVSVLCEVVVPQ